MIISPAFSLIILLIFFVKYALSTYFFEILASHSFFLYFKDKFNLEVYIDNTLYKSHKYELIFMQTILYSMNYLFFFLAGHKMNCLFNLYILAFMKMSHSSKHCFQMYFFNDVIKTYFLFKLLFY